MIATTTDLRARLLALSPELRMRLLAKLSDIDAERHFYDWHLWARPTQLPPPGDWLVWFLKCGRGAGKTRAGAQWVQERANAAPREILLIARTPADARDDMIEGPSGILTIAHPAERPRYWPSKRRLTWPNGSVGRVRSGAQPDGVRGFSGDTAWCDELFLWQFPAETWDTFLFGLREAKVEQPRICITSTPKRMPLVKTITEMPGCITVTESSYANRENLSKIYYQEVLAKYEGTTLGRQEIHAEVIEDEPGALWKRAQIDAARVLEAPPLSRIVVGVDPSGSSTGDEVGILLAGIDVRGHAYIIADHSRQGSPAEWGDAVVQAYYGAKADLIIGESNYGGEMVEHVIRSATYRELPYKSVHASRGKQLRAEPVAALYERGRVHHVGQLAKLEDELCQWVPGQSKWSPNRLDAAVWVITELLLGDENSMDTPAALPDFSCSSPWRI